MNCISQRCRSALGGCLLVATMLMAASCSRHVAAPVKNLTTPLAPPYINPVTHTDESEIGAIDPSSNHRPDYHIVQIGDTLYSIAWHYGLDFRRLADINQIENFKIYPGDKVYFTPQTADLKSQSINPKKLRGAIKSALGHNKSDNWSGKSTAVVRKSAKNTTIHDNKVKQKLNKTNKRFTNQNKRVVSGSKEVATTSRGQQEIASVDRWLWPTQGAILAGFSNKLHGNKGLDISGKLGQPVRAAAPGRVVYRGNALKGYGNLIIVKHNDDFLSAYAHNAKIHVQENEIVKAGQVIADIGSSGTDKNKLHFEIRYQGKPVNPMKYLPKL